MGNWGKFASLYSSYSPDYELLDKKTREYKSYIAEYDNKPKIKKTEKLFYNKKVLVETREYHRPKDPKCD